MLRNFKRILLFFVLFSLFFSSVFSQGPKHRVVSIPVTRNTISLKEPWTGGLNSPQFSAIDLNDDNLPDLFVFDKVGDKVLTYINTGTTDDTAYVYAPQYEELFPADLFSWALIRDYNNDGVADIFTHASLGTRVYKGSKPGGQLHFDLVSPLLVYNDGNFNVNIFTGIDDVPVFADVNRDGDIDILTYGVYGASIEYYENQSVEHSGDLHYNIDSFKYLQSTRCWGNIQQNSSTNSIALGISCKGGTGEESPNQGSRHSGNTIFNFDFDNDHDVDLLNGNIGYDNLALLHNCGDSTYANVCDWDSVFPACNVHVEMPTYPAAYAVDINNDGFEDLLIAPNARDGSRDIQNVMSYKNNGTLVCPFEYQTDTFIVNRQLDFGTESKPALFDFNGDGLKDVVVGNYGYFRPFQTYKSTLAVYINTGTATQPQFTETETDYKNFSQYLLVGASPAFGDLDGDGKEDMLVGDLNGYLSFFKNTGTTGAIFASMTAPQYFGIDVGQNATPFIYDVNGDQLNDILVGKKDGKISYFWNMGTANNPVFDKDSVNKNFGNINVTQTGYSDGSSKPFVLKEANGALKLFVGCYRGIVYEYDLDITKLRSGTFTVLDTNYIKHDVGSKAAPTIADLNNDGLLEYIIGNSRGGLLIYSDSLWNPETEMGIAENSIPNTLGGMKIYPNPSRDYFVCEMQEADFIHPTTELYNILGERVDADNHFTGKRLVINTGLLRSGFYVVRITDAGKTYTGKILLEK